MRFDVMFTCPGCKRPRAASGCRHMNGVAYCSRCFAALRKLLDASEPGRCGRSLDRMLNPPPVDALALPHVPEPAKPAARKPRVRTSHELLEARRIAASQAHWSAQMRRKP